MTTKTMFSLDFNWRPDVVQGGNRREFESSYVVSDEAKPEVKFYKTRFSELRSFGMWADRSERDEELLEELGGSWRDLGK
ncbi:MAG: hypothetical protein A2Y60_05435 [Chloroflexi bacterium RBG_13_54_9]|nr:MAG: hypothetical protein A2Y60_05435 [Chloroflexi bacterium RBG_13_54_9]